MRMRFRIIAKVDRRGYVLLTVLLIGVIVAVSAGALVLTARETARAGALNEKAADAYGIALGGLTWATTNLDNNVGKAALQNAAAGTPTTAAGVLIRPFNPDDQYAGAGSAPPAKGTSNSTWQAYDSGHYALLGANDAINQGGIVVRSVGVAGSSVVVLETNLKLNILRSVPAGLTGCFDGDVQITFYDQQGPYDYFGNVRFDGNGGVPIGMSDEHDRLNGFARYKSVYPSNPARDIPATDVAPVGVTAGYPRGHRWRGTQSLRGEPLATGISTAVGGAPTVNMRADNIGNNTGWSANPYIANDPRIAYFHDTTSTTNRQAGLGLGAGGLVDGLPANGVLTATIQRGMPIISYVGTPNTVTAAAGGFYAEEDWAPLTHGPSFGPDWGDEKSRKGFYGCDNHTGADGTFTDAMNGCIKGSVGTSTITSIDDSGTGGVVAITVSASHGLAVGDTIDVRGADGSGATYDGRYTVATVPTSTTLTTVQIDPADAAEPDAARTTGTLVRPVAPEFNDYAVNHSGRAMGFLQSIVRQCTGSGASVNPATGSPFYHATNNPNGVKCAPAFEYLENVAACLVLPPSVTGTQSRGTNANRPAGNGNLRDDFNGCHPGCLLAADFDSVAGGDTPYRSVCLNLDAAVVTTYGPDIQSATSIDTNERVAGIQPPPYLTNWITYAKNSRPGDFIGGDGVTAYVVPTTGYGTGLAITTPAPGMGSAVPTANRSFNDVAVDGVGNIIRSPGVVSERGNSSLISRLDMTDRGPLGTCQQNCLAFRFGGDRTYGAHRSDITGPGSIGTTADTDNCSAKVPTESGTAFVHCNLDYDQDGVLDRKSYAIASSFREECADPHDGVAWSPTFNISTQNSNITSGCVNDLPNITTGGRVETIVPFCDQGQLAELNDSIAQISAGATNITPTNANTWFGNKTTLTDGQNWFGGATCHLGSTVTSWVGRPAPSHTHTGALATVPLTDVDALGRPDYWIEDECPNPQVVKITGSASSTGSTLNIGTVCGCGVLILKDIKFNLTATSTTKSLFLWRGLVVWQIDNMTGSVYTIGSMGSTTSGVTNFIIEGGMVATGDQNFAIDIAKGEDSATSISNNQTTYSLKQQWRMNPKAINDALAGANEPLRAVRRVR